MKRLLLVLFLITFSHYVRAAEPTLYGVIGAGLGAAGGSNNAIVSGGIGVEVNEKFSIELLASYLGQYTEDRIGCSPVVYANAATYGGKHKDACALDHYSAHDSVTSIHFEGHWFFAAPDKDPAEPYLIVGYRPTNGGGAVVGFGVKRNLWRVEYKHISKVDIFDDDVSINFIGVSFELR